MNKKQANANLFSARPFASVLLTSILLTATTANATVVSSEADAYALGIDLSLDIPGVNLSVDVLAPTGASGIAPSPFNNTNSILGSDLGLGTQVTVAPTLSVSLASPSDAAVLEATASSNVDGTTGSRDASGNSTATGLTLDILNTLLAPPIGIAMPGTAVSISASALNSTSTVSGDYGSLSSTGSSYIADLAITLFGTPLIILGPSDFGLITDVNGGLSTSPNFEALNVGGIVGLNLILNEQTGSCTNTLCDLTVNALRLSFDAVDISSFGLPTNGLLSGTLSGDITLGHSYSQLAAVDNSVAVSTPTTVSLFALALLGVAFSNRKLVIARKS